MATAPPFTTEGYPYQNPPSYQSQYPQAHANQGFNDPSHNINQGGPPSLPPPSALAALRAHTPEGIMDSDSEDNFSDKSIRRAFIRKVYLILTSQLIITLAFVVVFSTVTSIKIFVFNHSWIYFLAYGVFIVMYLLLICVKSVRRNVPWNYICLLIFTLAFTYMTAMISAYHKTYIVLIALAITVAVCIGVTIFAIQTKIDFTLCSGVLFVCSLVVLLFGIACILVYVFAEPDKLTQQILQCVYGALCALLFSAYLVFDTQMLIGNKKNKISEEEYVYAALQLYVDVVQIFLAILQITGAVSK